MITSWEYKRTHNSAPSDWKLAVGNLSARLYLRSNPPAAMEPQYLNLTHQFLDTNFIESQSRRNSFTLLPILSTNPKEVTLVTTQPPMAVDYFSYELTSGQYHSCWKNITNNQFMKQCELSNIDNISKLKRVQPMDDLMTFMPTTSRVRLENACWRAWYKNMNKLKELDPAKINWFKENDVTVLYGPLILDDEEQDALAKDVEMTQTVPRASSSNEFSTTDDELMDDDETDMFQNRRDSLSSASSYSSANSDKTAPLKSILKKRSYPKDRRRSRAKRISFGDELFVLCQEP